MAHFQIKDLTFSYPASNGRKSLDSVTLSIDKGEYIVICGKSGSGKTTLLRQDTKTDRSSLTVSLWIRSAPGSRLRKSAM